MKIEDGQGVGLGANLIMFGLQCLRELFVQVSSSKRLLAKFLAATILNSVIGR